MFEFSAAEVVGYVASALIVVSLSMSSVVRLRMISLAGSITFVVYGSLISALPIVIANTIIAGINIWYLRAELGGHRDLGASMIPADTPFLVDFLDYHDADIRRFQPTYEPPHPGDLVLLLTRDGLPAGVIAGERRGDDHLHVTLDYVQRTYRDSRLGGWLYGKGAGVLRRQGIQRVTTDPGNEVHRAYLDRIGFEVGTDGEASLTLP